MNSFPRFSLSFVATIALVLLGGLPDARAADLPQVNLACGAAMDKGDLAGANRECRQAVLQAGDGSKNALAAQTQAYDNLAELLLAQGQYAEADATYKKTIALLEKSGYQGEKLVLLHATYHNFFNPMGTVAARLLTEAGFAVDAQAMDWGTVQTRRTSREIFSFRPQP